MYYVFDAVELIMGPYDTFEEAQYQLDLFITECYLLDDYPNPYVDYMEEEYDFSWLAYGSTASKRERIIKRKKTDGAQ